MISKRFVFPYALALITAVSYAAWAVLSLLFVNSSKVSLAVSLNAVNILLLLFSSLMVIFFVRRKDVFFMPMVKLAAAEGALYVAANLLMYYALSYAQAFPLTQSFFYGSILVFALLVRKVNKSRSGFKYLLSTVLVFFGIAAVMFGVYGSGFSFSPLYLLSLFMMIVLYGIASYFAFYSMKSGYDPLVFQATTAFFEVVLISAAIAFQPGLLGEQLSMSAGAWLYAAAIAAVIAIGYLSSLYAFRAVKKEKARVINTVNILINLQFIGVVLYSVLFLSLNWMSVVIGGILLLAGIVFLQLSK